LARLDVTTATGLPPAEGDFFTISLDPSTSSGFLDSQGNSVAYTSTPGTVTIVPEPCTLSLFAAAVLAGMVLWKGRRKLNRG
jgi:hypothetical protein